MQHVVEVHARASPQVTPSAFFDTHAPPSQYAVDLQRCASVSTVQLVAHALSTHLNVPHETFVGVLHVPAPSHFEANASSPAQSDQQIVLASGRTHVLRSTPSHLDAQRPVPVAGQAA